MRQKILAVLLAVTAALTCAACGNQKGTAGETKTASADAEEESEEGESEKNTSKFVVGISAPAQPTDSWSGDLTYLSSGLEEAGFSVVTQQAADGAEQAEQLGEMAEEISALILIPLDSEALADALDTYDENEITVINYNQLVPNVDAVDYYVGFDSQAAGEAVGKFIETQKNLGGAQNAGESYTIEFLLGNSKDLGNQFFYEGVMSVLKPYFENGTLQSKSGKSQFTDLCLGSGDAQTAKTRTTEILGQFYAEEPLDILCAQSDQILDGAVEALNEANYSLDSTVNPWPLLTGQGAAESGVRRILTDNQGMTISEEYHLLDDSCRDILESIESGEDVEVNTPGKYDNGSRIVPAQLSEVQAIDGDNYKILADMEIYTEEELEALRNQTE